MSIPKPDIRDGRSIWRAVLRPAIQIACRKASGIGSTWPRCTATPDQTETEASQRYSEHIRHSLQQSTIRASQYHRPILSIRYVTGTDAVRTPDALRLGRAAEDCYTRSISRSSTCCMNTGCGAVEVHELTGVVLSSKKARFLGHMPNPFPHARCRWVVRGDRGHQELPRSPSGRVTTTRPGT